jgi:YhcH/YjgK/YiaL family protein
MILDALDNAALYRGLHKLFPQAIDFLLRPDLLDLSLGRHETSGTALYALAIKEAGRREEDARLETHRNCIDIQMVLRGTERMGWKPSASLIEPVGVYDPDKDFQLFNDKPDAWLAVRAGQFAVFFPEDGHAPWCHLT